MGAIKLELAGKQLLIGKIYKVHNSEIGEKPLSSSQCGAYEGKDENELELTRILY